MDIYDFFQSKEIVKHCKKIRHSFNPLEMAIIVYLSEKPIKQKHEAYRQIIDEYPDMPIDKSFKFGYRSSLHEYLCELMEYENRSIKAIIGTGDSMVFCANLWYSFDEFDDKFNVGEYITTFEKAKHEIVMQWKYDKDKVVYAEITKFAVDGKRTWQHVHIDKSGEITSLFNFDENKPDLLDMIFINIPVPFVKGDLVTFGDGRPYVLRELPQFPDDDHITDSCIDELDMLASVFCIRNYRLNGVSTSCSFPWKMRYFVGILKGQERFLKYLGEFIRKNSDDFEGLTSVFMQHYTEAQSADWANSERWHHL